ncbi:glutathione S-transferase family protein [Acuticoccus sp. I52.16.1]|uniref:glutathione S-transferase family protein n=1 Tax=Acuticoccus sp. I52.16.1 TaxID=2928472 RepID=UPI001FD1E4F3|nr:glutathione S-transferase family protein [Acuticoccus sp. I52.16.1]UOM33965.1 glutathione S-transferase family protein [Acuticoccus sp. I52.16.1]
MGYMLNGTWRTGAPGFADSDGEFKRKASNFRSWVTADGRAGPTGEGGFKAEPGRFHLYVALACPWAHRALIMRRLKGLEDMVGLSVVHWHMGEDGWTFEDGPGVIPDMIKHARFLREVYQAADPDYTGRVTVPVLWDKERGTIVNNESAEVIRMLGCAFDEAGAEAGDYRPEALREEIDAVNARIYDTVNNGVYKAGFAGHQRAYEAAVTELFASLDWLEGRLEGKDYLVGDRLTEADIRLFTTLVRFDPVYHGHFKCNVRRIVDYPNLWRYLKALYAADGFGDTTNHFHIKQHYYTSHPSINPTGIVPLGPDIDYS